MHILTGYWWVLLIAVVAIFMIPSVGRTPRLVWAWLLRLAGGILIAGALMWFVTGDIDEPYFSLHFTGPLSALIAVVIGILALTGANRLSSRAERMPKGGAR